MTALQTMKPKGRKTEMNHRQGNLRGRLLGGAIIDATKVWP